MGEKYPPDWDRRRKIVYRRDDYRCQKCGAKGGPLGNVELHCHHVRPISEGGSHQLENLQTLCRRCHNSVHDHHIPQSGTGRSRKRESWPRTSSRNTSGGDIGESEPWGEPSNDLGTTGRILFEYFALVGQLLFLAPFAAVVVLADALTEWEPESKISEADTDIEPWIDIISYVDASVYHAIAYLVVYTAALAIFL